MKLKKLALKNFRNIDQQSISLNDGLNVLRGQNGQGKTNLIEAISFITQARSFRTHQITDLIQKNTKGFFLEAEIVDHQLTHHLSIGVGETKKNLILNHKKTSSLTLKKKFHSILFSPESLLIVKEAPQKRRDLVDSLCTTLFPQFALWDSQFRRLIKQKNTVLKSLRERNIDDQQGFQLNKLLTEQMLQIGAKITSCRLKAFRVIEPILLQEFLNIMDEHYGNISLKYEISGQFFEKENESEILNAMYKRWIELNDREVASGACLVGPHKHEIHFNFNDHDARFFCSQGQQRAIILAFKMAHTKLHYGAHNEYPILLLDDVLSELDREKQLRFVNYLLSTEAQIFLTTTDATVIPQIAEKTVFEVKEGCFIESGERVAGGLNV